MSKGSILTTSARNKRIPLATAWHLPICGCKPQFFSRLLHPLRSNISVSRPHMLYQRLAAATLLLVLPLHACPPANSNAHGRDKTVWNYSGGVLLETDGSLPDGPCFRLTGKVTEPEFFENLKREDSNSGTVYRRGNEIVTEFPRALHLTFLMYDMPCDNQLKAIGSRVYLNRALMGKLHLGFFWKRGTELRPASGVALKTFEIHALPHYAE